MFFAENIGKSRGGQTLAAKRRSIRRLRFLIALIIWGVHSKRLRACEGSGKPFAYDLDVFGKVLAGTPERPLTSDAFFALNGKSKNKQFHPDGNERDRSLKLEPIGSIAVHSSEPTKARLVFKLDAASRVSSGPISPRAAGDRIP